jgi:erythronate-4-phosphate dehydrogenase
MVVFVEEQIPFLRKALGGLSEVHTFSGRKLVRKDLLENNCEILFVRSTTKVDATLLEGTKVHFVGTATSGIEHIDVDYLRSKGIAFADAKGSNANSVAEYVVFSILLWASNSEFNLKGKTIGIIGYGNIGKLVAKYSNLLGLRILVNDPPLLEKIQNGEEPPFPNFTTYTELDELIEASEILTNHTPLTYEGKYPTAYLLNQQNLARATRDLLFIHTSRGGVVEEEAMLGIAQSHNAVLVVDVWENEPEVNCNLVPLCLVATPHVAGYSFDGKLRGSLAMLKSFESYTGLTPNYSEIEEEINQYQPLAESFFEHPKKLFAILSESRKILEDSASFKKICDLPPNKRNTYFDSLRKNYPLRREIL